MKIFGLSEITKKFLFYIYKNFLNWLIFVVLLIFLFYVINFFLNLRFCYMEIPESVSKFFIRYKIDRCSKFWKGEEISLKMVAGTITSLILFLYYKISKKFNL